MFMLRLYVAGCWLVSVLLSLPQLVMFHTVKHHQVRLGHSHWSRSLQILCSDWLKKCIMRI